MTIPDYIKTILNSLKQYFATKKEVRQVVSDLSKKQDELISGGASVGQFPKIKSVDSNGKPTEWETAVAPGVGGYGYSESGNQVLLDNSVYVGEQRGWEYIEYGIPIILGNTYDVTFDGVKYSNLITHENFDDMGRIVYIGDQELSNPPFHIDYSEQLDAILVYPEYSKIPSEVSVKIECVGEVTHQIDKKYIPTGAGLPEVDVGDDGAFLVANGNEWIKSKGGVGWSNYDQDEEIIHKINPKYISDDGYGYTYKEILAEDVSFKGELQLQNFNLVYGEKYDVTFDGILYSNLEPYNDDGYITIGAPYGNYSDYPFNISHTDNSPPYVFASGNITHVVTVSRSEEIIHKIDEKYLPEGGGGTSDHSQLENRDADNQHPMSAIAGLQSALDEKANNSDIPSLDGYATEPWVENQGYLTEHQSLAGYATETYVNNHHDSTKQDVVSDLATIRSGASKGATAVQPESGKGLFSGNYNDLTNKPTIPSAVTESTVSGWGFTKNTGTYNKPSGGIPKTDLASAVQTSLSKADTALQQHQDISGKQDVISDLATIRSNASAGASKISCTDAQVGSYGYIKLSDLPIYNGGVS